MLMALWTASSADGPRAAAAGSDPLRAAIERVAPNAKLLQANEIDMRECEFVPKNPGLASADFNGDGLEDAAVLLKTRVSSEVTILRGVKYRKATLLFVIFLNDSKGGYLTVTQDQYGDSIPAWSFIDIIPTGKTIRNIKVGKDLVLKNPAVMLTFCGKSAAAYVVTGTRVREIPLSD